MNLPFQADKGFAAGRSDDVVLANLPLGHLLLGSEISGLFQPVENGVNRSGADVIAVPPQFQDHFVAVNRVFGSVMKNVHPDES